MTVVLSIQDVDKFYGPVNHGVHAVKQLSMEIRKGEIVALLGSSGCGKTSTLRMIAGFEEVSRGTISLAGTRRCRRCRRSSATSRWPSRAIRSTRR